MIKYAIIVAGGSGSRMGSDLPKQFMLLKDKPVLYYSIKPFLDAYEDLEVILVLPAAFTNIGEEIIDAYFDKERIKIAVGGDTRFQSVKNGLKLVWCLCINANLYIENKVPPAEMLMKHDCPIVLGTDSYSSNWQLSIAKEMQSLKNKFPSLSIQTILQWATSNGAKALQWDDELGSFEKGKNPGVAVIDSKFETSKRIV